jgi:hypothetical protein
MSDLTPADGTAGVSRRPDGDAVPTVGRIRALLAAGNTRTAREVTREAMNTLGRQADLLWSLADTEFADGDLIAGRERLDEAFAVSPRDAASLAKHIQVLRRGGFWRDALTAVQAAPGELRTDPLVRVEAGSLYRACWCPAHAACDYGTRRDLPRSHWAARRWCWLRSGGPSSRLRGKMLMWEEILLEDLRHPPDYIASISDIGKLDAGHVQLVRAQLETTEYRFNRQWYGWLAMLRAGYRLIPLSFVPVWLVLAVITSLARFTPGPAGTFGFAAIGAAIATLPVILAVRAILTPAGQYRFVMSDRAVIVWLIAVAAGEALAGEGYARRFMPVTGWSAAVVLGLVVIPAALACLPIALTVVYTPQARRARRMLRENSLLTVIHSLLLVRYDLGTARGYRGVDERLYHGRLLEQAAQHLARGLLPQSDTGRLGSDEWLRQRAAGWAEAIRHMQRQVLASLPGSSGKLQALLAHEIRCLATCDFGALAWRQPPPLPPRRVALRKQAISAARALFVAGVPFAAVLVSQPFLRVSPGLYGWARIVTAAWALLYMLLSIDPTIRDKISVARDLTDLIRTNPPPREYPAPGRRNS